MVIGLVFMNLNNMNQLIFVEGSSLSVVTEKTNFTIGENITINLVNSGTIRLKLDDILLKITSLDGRVLYSLPMRSDQIIFLEPQETKTLTWNQIRNDGSPITTGSYKIISSATDDLNYKITKSIIINVNKTKY